MNRKLVFAVSLLLFMFSSLHVRSSPVEMQASNGYPVHNLDTGINYTTIQEAINAPETDAGDTIFVDAGTYYENVEVNKSVSLVGENKDTTVIDGGGSLEVLAIRSDGVSVSGFTVMHSYGEEGWGGGGLVVGGVGNVQISDIIASDNDADWGMHLVPGSHDMNITHTVIVNNSRGGMVLNGPWKVNVYGNTIVRNNGTGIALMHAQNNSIFDNNITANKDNGIHLWESSNNTICGNTVTNNNQGISFESSSNNSISGNKITNNNQAISFKFSSNNSISVNNITNNKGYGIHISESSNNSISGNNITNNNQAIRLHYSSNNSISGNKITANLWEGILFDDSSNNSISGNTITSNNAYGIEFWRSSNNTIRGNTVTANNDTGVIINYGNNNSFLNNTIFDNYVGFSIQSSNNNTLSDNQMTNNTLNFAIGGSSLPHFLHDIDSSNTVNGKPMYYWVNEENRKIPSDAGYVAVVNSRNITVQDLNLTHNAQGVLLAYTTNSTVKNVTAEDNAYGITIQASYNNTITNNTASNNVVIGVGILLQASYNNTLLNNVASNNALIGIALIDSRENILRNNTMNNNTGNFGVLPGPTSTPSMFINDVDTSNKVDGKPIYYWVNQSDREVPSDAGCVLLVNSTNITVRDSNLTKNVFGILLVGLTNSTIKNVTAQNNVMGIALMLCVNTMIEENSITNNAHCGFIVVASLNSNLTQNWVSGNGFTIVIGEYPLGGFFVESNITTIANNTITNNLVGITLLYSHNNKVTQNNITNNENGISLQYSNSNMLTRNNVTHNAFGIQLDYSDRNELTWNRVANNTEGIRLQESYANILTLNNITLNINRGLDLANSGRNTLRNNSLTDNQWNFGIWGDALSDFINDMDTSNTVNDNPIVYLINKTDLVINPSTFPQVGCLVLVNSTNITVQSLTLANNYESLTFAYTNDSAIANITATNNVVSLLLWDSNNNTITANTMRDNLFGPLLGRSNDNKLINNNITNNSQGIGLFGNSHNNTLVGNFVKNNSYGIYLRASEENTFYHNNFINNTNQADIKESFNNIWDNGIEGNYWSNYIGVDHNQDGIGDSRHAIDKENQDIYPLMGMFSSFNTSLEYPVNVISNSTIGDFYYFESNSTIKTYISNMTENQTFGFCRVCIPHALMDPDSVWIVIDDGETEVLFANLTLYDNTTHRWIYFAYPHSTHEVIIGEDNIRPEIENVFQQPANDSVYPDDKVKVNATVTDNLSGVKQVTLNFTYTNSSGTWTSVVNMTNLEGNIWNATIPAFPYCTNVTYIIIAEDNANNTITSEELAFDTQYHVIPEFPSFLMLPLFMTATLLAAILLKKTKHLAQTKRIK